MMSTRAIAATIAFCCVVSLANADEKAAQACSGRNCMQSQDKPVAECKGQDCNLSPTSGIPLPEQTCTGQNCAPIPQPATPQAETVKPDTQ